MLPCVGNESFNTGYETTATTCRPSLVVLNVNPVSPTADGLELATTTLSESSDTVRILSLSPDAWVARR